MRRHLLVIAGIAILCIGLAFALSGAQPKSALAAAPRGATAIAHVSVPALRASPIWQAIAGSDDDRGLAHIRETCGLDPLELLRSVAVFVVGSEARPLEHTGFIARGDFPRDELVECVQRVVEGDGGAIRAVSIEGVPAIASAHGPSRAAFLGGDRIVGGDEIVVRQAILVDHGDAPGADGDPVLARLWQRVARREQVVAVARVPANWRAWLSRMLGGIAGLDAVTELGVGVQIERGLGLTVALEVGTPENARTLLDSARARIEGTAGDFLVGASALGTALRRIELDAQGSEVTASLDLDEDQLARLVALVRDQLDRRRMALERAAAAALEGARQAPQPDEELRPEAPSAP